MTLEDDPGSHDTPLRKDAARNLERLVAAARGLFAERGLDVPLEAVARAAGVGIATLYRRFPTRADLIVASFAGKFDEYAEAAERALDEPDAWQAFAGYVEHVCAMQAEDSGVRDVLTMTFPTAAPFAEQQRRAYEGFSALVARCQREGVLRPDFVPEDLPLLLMANAGVINATKSVAPDAWRRFVAYALDAWRNPPIHSTLPEPVPPTELYEAMVGAAGRRGR